ncbi:MAG: excinuclease ABC subunit UvrB [Alphaproteobacteria bacterium]|nr:excinuclease ABC subunit UvrB [Alphaproteobacteria bacterium]
MGFRKRASVPPANFELTSDYKTAGDQPEAIKNLIQKINKGEQTQVLLGVTGSGKTFTMAHVIAQTQRPALIMAPNKTLAAQLFEEMQSFFPKNHIEYFVSYYDYYQPEAYIPRTDTYIEKDASINDRIDRLRHRATRSILEHNDVIIVASVSCIYGLGDITSYSEMSFSVEKSQALNRDDFIKTLIELQYNRADFDFTRGSFRVRGDYIDIFPPHAEDRAWRVIFFGDDVEDIIEIDSLSGKQTFRFESIRVYPNSHHITPRPTLSQAIKQIKADLKEHLALLSKQNKQIEAHRLKQRTEFDIEMLETTGMCKGIENYSRYLTGRNPGEAPPTLFEYLPKNALLFADESHVAIPQIRGMFNGDRARKDTLIEHGFRLPVARDNRPLKFEEWEEMRPQTTFISATPGDWELDQTNGVFTEQVIRPTGLIDPIVEIRPAKNQVEDFLGLAKETVAKGHRILCTTLTKRMSEQLTDYLHEHNLKAKYMHSDIDTLERIEIIRSLRLGEIDILVGINLLREGLDIPECALVTIMDADKEGFLRSTRSLIQTIGRAARHIEGRAILYADKKTKSMEEAISESNRRREKQIAYNKENNITPQSIQKAVQSSLYDQTHIITSKKPRKWHFHTVKEAEKEIEKMRKKMLKAADLLDFETASKIRDDIKDLEKLYNL